MAQPDIDRWRRRTLCTLFAGYAGYYICRSNLSVVTPLLLAEFEGVIDKKDIGAVASAGVLAYSLGKVSNGLLVDFLGGRRLFLLGMAASIACTVLFGFAGGLTAFTAVWVVNRYVQSAGWGAAVKVASRWFPVGRHATLMGILSMSYLIGDAVARAYLGEAIELGLGWRGVFWLSAATLGVIALVTSLLLKDSPGDVGLEEPGANPENVFGARGSVSRPAAITELIGPLARSPMFWLVCVISFGLTLLRETFNFWTPTWLTEVGGLDAGGAAIKSLLVPLVGALSAYLAGRLSDRLAGRHGLVIVPCLVGLCLVIGALAFLPLEGRPVLGLALISLASFCLIGPYSFLAGVIALDLGGKLGSSTTAGLIDSAGYIGAIVSGYGIGAIAQDHGWSAAFGFLAGVATLTALVALVYWRVQEAARRRT